MEILSIWDLLLPPLYIFLIYVISSYRRHKMMPINDAYKYYPSGLMVKLGGAVAICLVYTLYYSSGDSTGYFLQSKAIANLLFKEPAQFFDVMFNGPTASNYSYFDDATDLIGYHTWMRDSSAIYISRIIAPFCILGMNSFVTTSILLAWACYPGIWKLYLLFTQQFPLIKKELAISLLFIPSVVFWGSGLLKDTVTLSSIGWYSYSFYYLFIRKEFRVSTAAGIIISTYLLLVLKPYILFALLPGSLIWLSYVWISNIKIRIIRVLFAPLLLIGGAMAGMYALSSMGNALGVYSVDTVLERASVVQKDLKRDYYGGNSFDIGDFDASVTGVLSKAPLAINAALFRPYLWEVRNPLMLLSSLESSYILMLTGLLMFKLKIRGFFRLIWANPLLLFSILFSLFFAFSVGLSTPNFGALSRLKIPSIPFFVASLFVLRHIYEVKTKKKLRF